MRWICPVCREPLHLNVQAATCTNNHSFDRAKQGYYNLLLANQKRSQNPGDGREMMAARHDFLQAGYYQPLAEALVALVSRCADDRSSFKVLDVGCGEGYYGGRVAQAVKLVSPFAEIAGLDISRDALKVASRTYPEQSFVVASGFQLPLADNELDVVMRVFAPGDTDEALRVLKPEGFLIVAYPGPQHLYELRQQLYDEVKDYQLPDVPDGFYMQDEQHVSFEMCLNGQAQIQQLLAMTPFYWRGKREAKAALAECDNLTISADFLICCYGVDA